MAYPPNNTRHADPAVNYVAISKSDTVNFTAGICRAIYVGTAGNVVAIRYDGTAVTFVGAAAGSILPIQAIRVNSTDTTASNMVALY